MISEQTDPILEETLFLLKNHDTAVCSGLCTLKRLLHKRISGDSNGDASKINFKQIESRREERTVQELRELQRANPKAHDRISDIVKDDAKAAINPIVIVRCNDEDWLIDGSNRINYWYGQGDKTKKLLINHHMLINFQIAVS